MRSDYYIIGMNVEADDLPDVQLWPLYTKLYHGTVLGMAASLGQKPYKPLPLIRSTAYTPHIVFPSCKFHVSSQAKSVMSEIPNVEFVLSPLIRHIADPVDEKLRLYLDSISHEIERWDDWTMWIEQKSPVASDDVACKWPLYQVVTEDVVLAIRRQGADENTKLFEPRLEWDKDQWHLPLKLPRYPSAFDRSPILNYFPWTIITQSVLDLLMSHGFLPDPAHVLVAGVDTSTGVARRLKL
jgi:hypothetical protein